jgi:hypothetical protein
MSKKYNYLTNRWFTIMLFASTVTVAFAQAPKKNTSSSKTPVVKGIAKGTLAPDMDCTVKLNGVAKLISLKAYTPLDVILKPGDNIFEAITVDKKSTIKNTVVGKPGETVIVEISFFDDNKFLDYIKTGNLQMVEMAIKKNPGLINNADGTLLASPLQVAIENSQIEIVTYLMKNGASFLTPENIYPLHTAIKFASSLKNKEGVIPDKTLVDLFISEGCKITDKDDGGNTPLHCAVRAGKLDLVSFLVKMGADVNVKNDFDDTPLKIAEDKGLISILSLLEANGAQKK